MAYSYLAKMLSNFFVSVFFFPSKCIDYYIRGSNYYHRKTKVIIAQGTTPGCKANKDEALSVNIPLPWTLPTDYVASKIITIGYYIKVI